MKPLYADQGAILPVSELEVMNAVWEAREAGVSPITTKDVYAYAPALKRLDISTLIAMMNRLLAKGFLRIEKIDRLNTYAPLVDRTAYRRTAFRDFAAHVFGNDRAALAEVLFPGMTQDELAEVRGLFRSADGNGTEG